MLSILDLRPYHFTWAENLEQIFDIGAILSKRELDRRGIEYEDVGSYDMERAGKRFLFYDFSYHEEEFEIRYKWKEIEIDLNEYIPFYLFADVRLLPKFIYGKLKRCNRENKNGIIFFLKPLNEIIERIEYLICYGPGAGHGILFKSLDDFNKFIELPTPDPMKQALWNLLQTGANPYSDYHRKIIESEFLIKGRVPITLIDKVMYIGNSRDYIDNYQHLFKRIFKELETLSDLSDKKVCIVLPDLKISEINQSASVIHYINGSGIKVISLL